ncbi:MAG: hypothetical protein HWD59_04270 [Coxiellaceae bacterium]|nr:MAG: hypothetical protein HWD59_04270 [Coxiellaceae bacterium]
MAAALAFSKHYFRADLVGSIFKSAIKLNDIELADCIIETSLALENHEALRILQRILMNVDNKIKKHLQKSLRPSLKWSMITATHLTMLH